VDVTEFQGKTNDGISLSIFFVDINLLDNISNEYLDINYYALSARLLGSNTAVYAGHQRTMMIIIYIWCIP
jgi:hypothetical protein